jgi:hypothetical protein
MTTRVLILAAGEGTRWNKYRKTAKHKLVIEGEVLIERTIKQFTKYSNDLVVVGSSKSYEVEGARCYIPPHLSKWKDMAKFLSSKDIWSKERTVLVFGDVYFTDEAVETIMKDEGEFTFFLRDKGSEITGKPWREIFGIAFNGSSNKMLGDRMLEIIKFNKVLGSGGWYLFNDLKRNYKHDFSIEIDDWTEDFDFPQDLDTWEESRAAWLIKQNKKSPEPNET